VRVLHLRGLSMRGPICRSSEYINRFSPLTVDFRVLLDNYLAAVDSAISSVRVQC